MALQEFKKAKKYLDTNYDILKTEHSDEFVVIHDEKVISCGKDLGDVLTDARSKIGDELNHSVVEYLSSKKTEMIV